MDQTQLQEKIALYYQKLPEETKVLFAGMSWLETLKELDTKYGLNDEQIKSLGTETTILLLGIISPEDYEQTLKTEVKLDGTKTEDLIREIDEKILKDISPKLYEAFNKNIGELAENKYGAGFLDKFAKLPDEVKAAINDSSYQATIYEIGNKYALGIDKIGELEDITTKALVGLLKIEEYESTLKSKLGLSDDKNKEMVAELNEKIFKNIKELMKNNPIQKGKVPPPPYKKTVMGEQSPTVGAPTKREIPKPAKITINEPINTEASKPAIAPIVIKNIEVPKEITSSAANQESSNIVSPIATKYTSDQVDPYKEHGIEIISEENATVEKEPLDKYKEIIKTPEIKTEEVLNTVVKESVPQNNVSADIMSNFNKPNIMTDKLAGKMANPATVSNYALPKMGGGSHDPYHEEI
ncbi:hypothetical protein HXX01_00165 [Candidatus Nomurabacteria bacterium]|nr:hypothetical protein [Candidatus Nomurabacteria bacterium]